MQLCQRMDVASAEAGASWIPQDELEEFLRFANFAAARTCSRPGAIPAMPTREEVEAELNSQK